MRYIFLLKRDALLQYELAHTDTSVSSYGKCYRRTLRTVEMFLRDFKRIKAGLAHSPGVTDL